jgi:hypothetical protein
MRRSWLWLPVCFLLGALQLPAQVQIRELPREAVEARLSHSAIKRQERQELLRKMFAEAGCRGLAEQTIKYVPVGNLLCTLPGTGEGVIVVGAHFDCVDDGYGVVDNWSGASLLPSLYESLSSRPRRHTFVFIGFTEEEQGMVGSEFYVHQLSAQERAHIHAMLNLDTLGLSSTKVWLRHADPTLAEMLAKVAAAMKLRVGAVDFDKVGATDSLSFEASHIPSITIHSVMQQNYHILHSPLDKLATIDRDEYYDTYRLVAVYLAYLDGALQEPANAQEATKAVK